MSSLPKVLVDNIKENSVVLFLGAGASIGAEHPQRKQIPNGKELAKMLVDKFLGPEYRGIPLLRAAELAIAQSDLFTFQDYVASIFREFGPGDHHRLVPRFLWKAIFTTNYDLVIERAYEQAIAGKKNLQTIVPFLKNADRLEDNLKKPGSIPYVKLHGCMTVLRDQEIPLIVTTEQYLEHRKYRSFLFERFSYLASQFPVVYVGSNLEDFDIRAILQDLKRTAKITPHSYILLPKLKPAEKTFWEGFPFLSCIDMTFEAFLGEIDVEIPENFRKLFEAKEVYEHPICERFEKTVPVPESVRTLVSRDLQYINKDYKPTPLTPQQFYKGYYSDWSAVVYNYDFRRSVTDNIISEVFLQDESERGRFEEFYLIKGHAGAGKSILMQRLGWDAATDFNKLCLVLNSGLFPEYESLLELYRLCAQRIFVFIDPVSRNSELIELWLRRATGDKFPLTIIGAERNHEWNVSCTSLVPYVTETYELQYLKEPEIKELIGKLAEYKSLGYLEDLTYEQQKAELSQKAGRQLLVTLYEATSGRPFEEIIFDEYKSIVFPHAQSVYLTVCMLHQLGIPTRAGLISRVHSITFAEFSERFFKPLDFIVFTMEDKNSRDYVYLSRHPIVAEMVVQQALADQQTRFDEYLRILMALDLGYSSDRYAFIRLVNARELMSFFRDPQLIRSVYKASIDRVGEDALLLQQEAIFEMTSTDGSIEKSGELLRKALGSQPSNRLIKHSLAEWALRKAEKSETELEKNKYRHESAKICRELSGDDSTAYPFVTLIKLGIEELSQVAGSGDEATIERKVREIERIIAEAKQRFPEDSFLLYEESRFCEMLDRNPEAKAALEHAFSNNKGSPLVAVRLASLYEKKSNEPERAIKVLSECVDAKPSDKYANYNLAILLAKYHPEMKAAIKTHLRRSFTDGDSNYAAQFWYARFLYVDDPFGEAKKYFSALTQARLNPEIKDAPRGAITDAGKPMIFQGVVSKKEHSFGFIKRDGYQDIVFVHRNDVGETVWEGVREGNRVEFEMWFSYRGPKARYVRKEAVVRGK
jgi:cold shock CspA family protein